MTTPTKKIHPTYAAAVGKESIIDHFLPVPTKGSNRKGKTPAKSTKGKPKANPITPNTDDNANADANPYDLLSDEDEEYELKEDDSMELIDSSSEEDTDELSEKEAKRFERREARRKARKLRRQERKARKAGEGKKKMKDVPTEEEKENSTEEEKDEFGFRDEWEESKGEGSESESDDELPDPCI